MRKTIVSMIGGVVVLCVVGTVWAGMTGDTGIQLQYIVQPVTTMQGLTPAMCDGMDTYSAMKLTDTRNGQAYFVRKMPDGKCWMIDNLKLAGNLVLTPVDSDVLVNTPVDLSVPTTSGYLTSDGLNSSATASVFKYVDPSSTDVCVYGFGVADGSASGCGYLYNWYTATAGTGTSAATQDTTSSICPAGWGLPFYSATDSENDSAVLNGAMNGGGPTTSIHQNAGDLYYAKNWWYTGPFKGTAVGYWTNAYNGQGTRADFWNRNRTTSASRYTTIINTGWATGSAGNMQDGRAVRCILREDS